jgi:hypothetical protein
MAGGRGIRRGEAPFQAGVPVGFEAAQARRRDRGRSLGRREGDPRAHRAGGEGVSWEVVDLAARRHGGRERSNENAL